jgi:NRAMP (natural resistance-associated macrophage protein)-like metal ion transporter
VGSAIALKILFGLPIWAGAVITIFDSLLFLFIHYYGVRKLEGFFLFLILVMAFCFGVNMFGSKPDYGEMLRGTLIPSAIPAKAVQPALGLVGCVIMPHNIYLHSALVLTRKINMKDKNEIKEATIYNNIESGISLFASFLISTAVISTFAVYINTDEYQKDPRALDLETAADALSAVFGDSAQYIWAIGLLAAGQSSTMTGTYAG